MITACRTVVREGSRLGVEETGYDGSWFLKNQDSYGIISAILQNGLQNTTDCIAECSSWPEEVVGWCYLSVCKVGYGPQGEEGMCFPSVCSPAEIIIATVREATIENTNDFPVGVYGDNFFNPILNHSDNNGGLW